MITVVVIMMMRKIMVMRMVMVGMMGMEMMMVMMGMMGVMVMKTESLAQWWVCAVDLDLVHVKLG